MLQKRNAAITIKNRILFLEKSMLLSLCEESGEHNSNFGRVTATFHVFGSRNGFLVDTKDVAGIKKDRGVPEYLIGNPVRIGSGPAAVTSF
jgi:hypothetical protein